MGCIEFCCIEISEEDIDCSWYCQKGSTSNTYKMSFPQSCVKIWLGNCIYDLTMKWFNAF